MIIRHFEAAAAVSRALGGLFKAHGEIQLETQAFETARRY